MHGDLRLSVLGHNETVAALPRARGLSFKLLQLDNTSRGTATRTETTRLAQPKRQGVRGHCHAHGDYAPPASIHVFGMISQPASEFGDAKGYSRMLLPENFVHREHQLLSDTQPRLFKKDLRQRCRGEKDHAKARKLCKQELRKAPALRVAVGKQEKVRYRQPANPDRFPLEYRARSLAVTTREYSLG